MTVLWLCHDSIMTVSWLYHDCIMTAHGRTLCCRCLDNMFFHHVHCTLYLVYCTLCMGLYPAHGMSRNFHYYNQFLNTAPAPSLDVLFRAVMSVVKLNNKTSSWKGTFPEKAMTSSWKSIFLLHENLLPWKSIKLFMKKYFSPSWTITTLRKQWPLHEKVFLSFLKNYFSRKV